MMELDIRNKLYAYAFYSLAAATFIASLLVQNGYLSILAALLLLASAVYFHSGHIVNSLLLKCGNVIEIYNGYKLGNDLTAAVKKVGNEYFAVACVLLRGGDNERNGDRLTSLVHNADCPFEFSLGLRGVNYIKVLDGLEEKRRSKEIEIARSDPKKYDKVNGLRRELSLIESDIRNIRGNKLLALILKLKTFARSESEFEAAREATRNAERIASAFSSALGVESELLRGEQLLSELEVERDI